MISYGGGMWQPVRKNIGVEIIIILSILRVWTPITADNRTTDINHEHQSTLQVNGSTTTSHTLVKRCWNSVISGRPTLAKVAVAGSFFILMALVAGSSLFCHIYCKHKKEFAEIEEDLLAGRRCFKPQLEDLETGIFAVHIAKPVSFMKRVLQKKIRRSKKDEMEDEESEEDEEGEDSDQEDDDVQNEKPKTPAPEGLLKIPGMKKKERTRDKEQPEDESPLHGGDLRKPNKNENVIQEKAKGAELPKKEKLKGAELPKKEKLNLPEKGERSQKSDPMKKDKKPGENLDLKKKGKTEQPEHKKKKEAPEKAKDRKEVGKTVKHLGRRTEGKTKKEEKSVKKVVKKQEVVKKVKKEKKIKAPKPSKTKMKKAKKEKKLKNPKKK